MILLNTPMNNDNYIIVNSDRAKILHELNYIPIYRDIKGNNYYFKKTEELIKVVKEKWNLIIK